MGAADGRGATGVGPGGTHLFLLRRTLRRRAGRRIERVTLVATAMLLLRESDVRELLSMEALIPLMEEALRAYSIGGGGRPGAGGPVGAAVRGGYLRLAEAPPPRSARSG